MVNYQLGKIYKMVSPQGLVYIGSTCEKTLAIRKAKHHAHYISWKAGKCHYISSFKLFEESENEVDIVLLENSPCNNKDELHARERYHIEHNICVNQRIAVRTQQEWIQNNNEKIKDYHRKYRQQNSEKIKEYNKDSQRKYRENNREKLNAQANRKCICDCGSSYTHCNKTQHEKTNKHQNYINKITE